MVGTVRYPYISDLVNILREELALHHVYCLPKGSESSPEALSIIDMLSQVESAMKIPYDKRIFENDEVHKEKLMALSVMYRLRLPQTSKTKLLLYPHLVLCNEDNEPVIFYPQIRRSKNGRVQVTIEDYLKGLLKGRVKSLVEVPTLKDKSMENLNLLKEAYLETAQETRTVNKEWQSADAEWPK